MLPLVEWWERPRHGVDNRTVVILDDESIYFSAVGRVLKRLGYLVICTPFDPAQVLSLSGRVPGDGRTLFLLGAWHCPARLAAVQCALARTQPGASILVVTDGAIPATSPILRERLAMAASPIACTTAELDHYLQALVEVQCVTAVPRSVVSGI